MRKFRIEKERELRSLKKSQSEHERKEREKQELTRATLRVTSVCLSHC